MKFVAYSALLVAALGAASGVEAKQIWRIKAGAASMFFHDTNLTGARFSVPKTTGSIQWQTVMENQVSFPISNNSTLMFETDRGRFVRFIDGSITVNGGFAFQGRGRTYNYNNFVVSPNGEAPESDMVMVPNGPVNYDSPYRLDIQKPLVNFDHANRRLNIAMMDMAVSRNMASSLKDFEILEMPIGVVNFDADVEFVSGDPNETPNIRGPQIQLTQDVGLSSMSGLTQIGRAGTYPNGRGGFAISTTSCGIGTGDIPWFAPMNVNHPVIVQNMYRDRDGKFEMIGEAYLKHGFLSTNSSGCGTCDHPGSGQYLGPGCSDTYGTGNNSDRRYLGPKNEVNPFTGKWECIGSYFANFINDCVDRRRTTFPDAVFGRLDVSDQALINSSRIYYETYYITPNDIDKYNQIAYRTAVPTWSAANTRWNFGSTSGQIPGPAIYGWGDRQKIAEPRTEGDAIVAVKITNVGGGRYYYDYAVYVHDMDRQIRMFELPIETGLNLTNVEFRDIDTNATNDWTFQYDPIGKLRFYTDTYAANPAANALSYSRMYNFRFEADIAPIVSNVTLGLFKPGALPAVQAEIDGPTPPQPTTISGTVNLEDFGGTPPVVTFDLNSVNPSYPDGQVTTTPDANGNFSFTTTLRGEYQISAKASHWLRKRVASTTNISRNAITNISLSLVNGDVDGDNEIGPGDFGQLSTAFLSVNGDSNWNANADLDGDGEVGPGDFSILATNFLASGDDI